MRSTLPGGWLRLKAGPSAACVRRMSCPCRACGLTSPWVWQVRARAAIGQIDAARVAKVGALQVRVGQIRAAESRPSEHRSPEIRTREVGTREVDAAKVRAAEIQVWQLAFGEREAPKIAPQPDNLLDGRAPRRWVSMNRAGGGEAIAHLERIERDQEAPARERKGDSQKEGRGSRLPKPYRSDGCAGEEARREHSPDSGVCPPESERGNDREPHEGDACGR